MSRARVRRGWVPVSISILFALSFQAAAADWTIQDLGSIDGALNTFANDISNSGFIVGSTDLFTGPRAVGFGSAGAHELAGAADNGAAYAVNNLGLAVGVGLPSSGSPTAVAYSNGTATTLNDPNNVPLQAAYGVNDSGQVVGITITLQAYVYSGGQVTILPGLQNSIASIARGINNNGQVVGHTVVQVPVPQPEPPEPPKPPINVSHALLWSNGTVTDLGALPDFGSSNAEGVNDLGHVVGYGEKIEDSSQTRPFLYRDGQMIDLVGLFGSGVASGINNRDEVVGTSFAGAWLYKDGEVIDLTFIPEVLDAGWTLRSAAAINDQGQIVGWGYLSDGKARAFLLSPVPEPQVWLLFGGGLVVLSVLRRARRARR